MKRRGGRKGGLVIGALDETGQEKTVTLGQQLALVLVSAPGKLVALPWLGADREQGDLIAGHLTSAAARRSSSCSIVRGPMIALVTPGWAESCFVLLAKRRSRLLARAYLRPAFAAGRR